MFSVSQLHRQRDAELEVIVQHFPAGARVLEVGAGTGQQAFELNRRGFRVTAVDLETSNYAEQTVYPVERYDGKTLPFADGSFDVVFSSNVLEHVRDLPTLHAEMRRVLASNGRCVHVLPTDAWRLWTTLTAFPAAIQYFGLLKTDVVRFLRSRDGLPNQALTILLRSLAFISIPIRQRRHGERGNVVTEQWYFRPAWWRNHFREQGFEIASEEPLGIFYTGHMVWNSLPFEKRYHLARMLGSACHLFELRPAARPAKAE